MVPTDAGDTFRQWINDTLGSGPSLGPFGAVFNNAISTILAALWMVWFIVSVVMLIIGAIRWVVSRRQTQSMHMESAQQQVLSSAISIALAVVFVALLLIITHLVSG